MKIKALKNLVFWNLFVVTLVLGFNNCGGFYAQKQAESHNLGSVPYDSEILSKPEEQSVSVQSAEQLAMSMSSVTGISPSINAIENEYSNGKALMSENYALDSITSPMLVAITNLASRYCNEIVGMERDQASGERRFLASVDLTKGVGTLSESGFNQMVDKMALAFWGRLPTEEERQILNEGRAEFTSAIPSSGMNSSSQTRNLVLSVCSGMLSSFDSITI